MLARGYKGKEAARLVTRIDPGVVSLVPVIAENVAAPWPPGWRTED
jgi:hypothetical protein